MTSFPPTNPGAHVQHSTVVSEEFKTESKHVEHESAVDKTCEEILSNSHLSPEQKWSRLREEANLGEMLERDMSLWQAVKAYRKAIFWAGIASMSIVMEGYDGTVQNAFNSMPQYRERFGDYYADIDQWQIPANWQVAFSFAPAAGNWVGIYLGAWQIERMGYRWTLIVHYGLMLPFIALQVFAQNRQTLLAGGILIGVPFGIFATIATAYASEVCPTKLRPYMTGWINWCWVIGIFVGNGVVNGTIQIPGEWAFRAGFCTQWVWPIPLILAMYFAPESPWWLVRVGKLDRAEHCVRRLASSQTRELAAQTVSNMVRVNQLEKDVVLSDEKIAPWRDLFRGSDRRRTEISVMSLCAQLLCGDPFTGNPIYFFQQAGVGDVLAFRLGLGNSAVNLFACAVAYIAMARFGLRALYCTGLCLLTCYLVAIGGCAISSDQGNDSAKWGVAALVYVSLNTGGTNGQIFNFTRTVTMGPACYAIFVNSSSTRLRNKTISIARWCSSLCGIIFGAVLTPYMLNPSQWRWGSKTAFFWVPFCLICLIWACFRLPELKNRSFYELDVLFERQIDSRKFAATTVEIDADQAIAQHHHRQDVVSRA